MKNNTLKFVDKFKYILLVPILLVVLSVIFGVIFNLNYDYDFRKVSNFTVKFNTTVSEVEYDSLENEIDAILKENGFNDYRIERVGSGAKNSVFVRIANDDSSLDTKIESVKISIQENLLDRADNITSSVVISLTETDYSLPKNVTNMTWFAVLAICCIAIFVFAYTAYRYNLIAGCVLALSIAVGTIMQFASMVVFRIPFNYYFVVPFIVMILATIIISSYINNTIKSTLNDEAYSKSTNAERVEMCTSRALKGVLMSIAILAVLVLAVMFFGGLSLIYLGLAIIVGLGTSLFISLFFNTSLWALWYKKDKDKMLIRRLKLEKEREEKKNNKNSNKEDEKIVV